MKKINSQKHLDAFHRRGLSLPDWYVFSFPGMSPIPEEMVPAQAAGHSEGDPRGEVSVEECRKSLKNLLSRGWLQVVTDLSAAELIQQHKMKGLPDPVYGFPNPGDVDFTPNGVEEYRSLSDELYGPDFFVWAVVESPDESEVDYFALHRSLAEQFVSKAISVETPSLQAEIQPISAWCIYWWKCFASGFHVKIRHGGTTQLFDILIK
jgi:hypothetical protein